MLRGFLSNKLQWTRFPALLAPNRRRSPLRTRPPGTKMLKLITLCSIGLIAADPGCSEGQVVHESSCFVDSDPLQVNKLNKKTSDYDTCCTLCSNKDHCFVGGFPPQGPSHAHHKSLLLLVLCLLLLVLRLLSAPGPS